MLSLLYIGGERLIHNNIRSIREELGLTQVELAEKVNVSRQTIISLEKGSYNPTLELALKLSKTLNKKIDDVFYMEEL